MSAFSACEGTVQPENGFFADKNHFLYTYSELKHSKHGRQNESLTASVNRALQVMRFTIHAGPKITPFELLHGSKPRTELRNINDGEPYLSNWPKFHVSAQNRPKLSIYVGSDAEGDITNHIVMA